MSQVLYIILGIVAGIFGGMFGIGGGTILIPVMVYLFGLTQHQAQGTTLAIMVPPIGLLAAMRYYQSGNVKLNMAVFICLGFFIGGLIGANFIQNLPDTLLKKMFGAYLLFIALNMIVTKMMKTNLEVKIGSLRLKNPVLVASGTFGYAKEFAPYINLKKLGGIITKTITPKPTQGNPPPRVVETASGMLNAIGLQNEGIDKFVKEKMPFLRSIGVPIVVSISAQTLPEYVKLSKILNKTKGVDAIELNISCPNVKDERCLIYQDKQIIHKLVKQIKAVTDKTIIAKLSPNVSDIVSIAQAAEDAGCDSVSLINTFLAMSIDIETKSPRLGNVTGGLSGPAIKPIALRMVWQVAQNVDIPVIGMGGIINAVDALEFIIAGASAVCVGTANLVDPSVSGKIIQGIEEYLRQNKIKDIKKIIGCLKVAQN